MTEIRVGSIPESSEASSYRANIQMQGFAAGDVDKERELGAGVLGRRSKDPGAGANPESSVKFLSSSVHSEPDMDTIMPLPGSYPHAQSSPRPVAAFPFRNPINSSSRRTTRDGVGAGTARGYHQQAESDESSEEDIDAERSLVHSPRSIGFTNVEVSFSKVWQIEKCFKK